MKMASKNDTTKPADTRDKVANKAEAHEDNRPVVEQPETTTEIVNEAHDEKVKATDETRVSIDDLNGDNVLEKTTDNPVARSNRAVGEQGRDSKVREDGTGY